jgi:protein-tyrosine-phosphatase
VRSDRKRILFVCTANQRRSKTAEDLYGHDDRYEVKTAGVAEFASVRVTLGLPQRRAESGIMRESDEEG